MNESTNEEIDLQELGIRILRYFRQHFAFILLSSLVTAAIGFAGYVLLPPVYESDMVVMSDILPTTFSDRLTGSFQRLIRERNDSILGARLGLNASEATSILAIRIESVKKETNAKADGPSTFIITAEVATKTLFPKLQEGLINYLRNIEFVKIRVRLREQDYRLLIDQLTREINSLDSLKSRLIQGKPVYAKSSEMMLVDPTNIYTTRIDMQKQLIKYKDSLELFNSIQLIEGFTPFKKPANPKRSSMVLAGLALGFFGALGILTFIRLWKMAGRTKQA
jgi:hypothetical protein